MVIITDGLGKPLGEVGEETGNEIRWYDGKPPKSNGIMDSLFAVAIVMIFMCFGIGVGFLLLH